MTVLSEKSLRSIALARWVDVELLRTTNEVELTESRRDGRGAEEGEDASYGVLCRALFFVEMLEVARSWFGGNEGEAGRAGRAARPLPAPIRHP